MHILMVAAENGAIAGAKVGGMADVLRDVPRALAALGHTVTVVMPAYGVFHRSTKSRRLAEVSVGFAGASESVELFALPPIGAGRRVRRILFEHPLFALCGAGAIYCDDPPGRPFESDARKFALFCAAVGVALMEEKLGTPEVLHLHDWHAATLAVLARRHPDFRALDARRFVLTIHNLAMQGVRPLFGHHSSLLHWFPAIAVNAELLDTRYPNCYNPMRAAIMLCDRVHVVSPTYAEEICAENSPASEGLHAELLAAREEGRLLGILNGCEYPKRLPKPLSHRVFLSLARRELRRWIGQTPWLRSAHALALDNIDLHLSTDTPSPRRKITFVGRLTQQKFGLLAAPMEDGRPAIAHILDRLGTGEQLIVLGSGHKDIEQMLTQLQGEDEKLLFLCGFSEALSAQLYAAGDLFLMPSLFEPCGIAQMLAMRSGQPCVVNRTGGLADTVRDEVDGFVFDGGGAGQSVETGVAAGAAAMLVRTEAALECLREQPERYGAVREAARTVRFPWDRAAEAYLKLLYAESGSSA
ncbi:MAG: glycogen/starch synthase [Halieaceae bacterium]|jgi:starch synthase|nr:glycogen/starch synthase [Halieaceae bacterium]